MSWRLQNMSNEHRQFDIYLPGNSSPQVKIVPPHTAVEMPGVPHEVFDHKSGQKLEPPKGKNMCITPDGYIKLR